MTQFPNRAKLLVVLALVLLVASTAPAFSRATHEWQICEVFSEVEGQAFHDAARAISWAMDNTLLLSFKREIGRVPGNLGDHRVIGHGWTLSGAEDAGGTPMAVAVDAAKVAGLFQCTADAGEWTGGVLEASVTQKGAEGNTPLFELALGGGKSERAFSGWRSQGSPRRSAGRRRHRDENPGANGPTVKLPND